MPVGDTKSPSDTDPSDGDDGWMAEFSKFKNASKVAKKDKAMALSNAEIQSSIMSGTSMIGGRRKKRKGALTSSTGYSMTSSSIYRTEGLTLLDARFDKIEAEYAADDDDMPPDSFDDNASIMTGRMSNASRLSMVSRSSTSSSQAPNLVMRGDFDMIMDEFLDGHSMSGKKHVKKGRYQTGMQQLDEVRKELGWVPGKKTGQKVAT
jgi:protein LTV1